MAKILKILLFSFLIGIVLTVTSFWWWGFWDYFSPGNNYLPAPEEVFFPPVGGCFWHGGPWPFLGTCIDNELLNFGLDIVFWSAIVFGFWMLIKFLKKKRGKF